MTIELDLERRVRRLEWYNRVSTLALVVMLAYCILLGFRTRPASVAQPDPAYPRNIVAERVAVVDGEGRERIVLACPPEMEGGCEVRINDGDGKQRIGLVQTSFNKSFAMCLTGDGWKTFPD